MAIMSGCLRKMRVTLPDTLSEQDNYVVAGSDASSGADNVGNSPTEISDEFSEMLKQAVQYHLVLVNQHTDDKSSTPTETEIHINPLIGCKIRLAHSGKIICSNCGRVTKKSFSQGYCYPCFRRLAETDLCVMSPEKCHYHEGTCRDPAWGEAHCMQSHYVYLANSSAIKVGITRDGQIPTRWIDQGAIQGVPVLKTQSRQLAGFAEDVIRSHISDRTQWQTMLKGNIPKQDLVDEWGRIERDVKPALDELRSRYGEEAVLSVNQPDTTEITFPVLENPEKVKSLNFDKTPEISGVLLGIKGQYLMLDTGVLNIRKFTSYEVEFEPTD